MSTMSIAPKGKRSASRLQITRHASRSGDEALRLAGDVDAHTAPRLARAICARVDRGAERIVLEVDGVRHIDSSGLQVLVASRRHATGQGATVQVICRCLRLQRLFVITGLVPAADVFTSEDALARRMEQRSRPVPESA